MEKELKEVISVIETSTGKTIKVSHEKACRTLLAVTAEIKRLENVADVLKSNLIGSEKLPYTSEEGEVREEIKKLYSQNVEAIHKELPRDVFFGACSVSKTKIEEKDYRLIVEKYTDETGEETPFIKIYPTTKATKLDVTIKM